MVSEKVLWAPLQAGGWGWGVGRRELRVVLAWPSGVPVLRQVLKGAEVPSSLGVLPH